MKIRAIVTAAAAAALMLCGCERFKLPVRQDKTPAGAENGETRPPGKKFVPPRGELNGPNAGAVTLKEHLDAETKKRKRLEAEKQTLRQEKEALSAEVARLKAELARANRDIDEANAMMLKLEKRLTDWKKNVLGYREEIMRELKGNRQLLLRCVKALGVEAPVEVPPARPAATQPAGATTRPAPDK